MDKVDFTTIKVSRAALAALRKIQAMQTLKDPAGESESITGLVEKLAVERLEKLQAEEEKQKAKA